MNNMQNIIAFLNMVKNPKDFATKTIEQSGNPVLANMVKLANEGKTDEVEKVARNLFNGNGRDYDNEMEQFKHFLGK